MVRALLALSSACVLAIAQDGDKATVPFSNPSAPKRVTVSLLHGGITVKTHANAREVVVESRNRSGSSRGRSRREPPPGMRRINPVATGLSIEEENNRISIHTDSTSRATDITVTVPADTSVKLSTVNGGNIEVEGVSGEIDVHNVNGGVTLNNVSGAVVAHALNGKVLVTLSKVIPDKAMSFSTLNGSVDVTLPSDVKANLKMKSEHGEIYSDFEIQIKATNNQPTTSNTRGRYRLRFDRAMYGSINGGGPEFSFTTLNGTIHIRKK